jgi:hypothetical protein
MRRLSLPEVLRGFRKGEEGRPGTARLRESGVERRALAREGNPQVGLSRHQRGRNSVGGGVGEVDPVLCPKLDRVWPGLIANNFKLLSGSRISGDRRDVSADRPFHRPS